MKKYLVSGFDPFMGAFGGVRSFICRAKNKDTARQEAKNRYGESFGRGHLPHERGITVRETDLDKPPELPEHWQ